MFPRSPDHRAALVASGVGLIAVVAVLASFFVPAPPPPLSVPAVDARYRDASLPIEERVDDLLGRMTLEEKIGQMALVEKNSVKNAEDVATYGIGGMLSGGGGKPDDNTPGGWKAMVGRFSDAARSSRLGIPLLYGVDANHGNGNVPGATIFPHAIGLGAANDPLLTERVARATADESAALGIRWHFSPSLDLPKDVRWGRVYEAFSDDPARTAAHGAAYVRGLQGTTDDGRIDVLATPKHYVGMGAMAWGSSRNKDFHIDQGIVPDDIDALHDSYLPPFAASIDAGALSVMAGLHFWGSERVLENRHLLTDVLKDQLGFEGFVVSDWYGVYEVSLSTYASVVSSVNAGVDMVMLPFDYKLFVSDMRTAVANGDISSARVDDAVRRILRAKFALGLFDASRPATQGTEAIGSREHRALAREAVGRSLVLLRNRRQALPISPETPRIFVAGSAADNVGRQSGGWTVEWQGIDGNQLPGATSILAGIRAAAHEPGAVTYDEDGNFPSGERADVGIAVVGEGPYAEGWGDNARPRLDDTDLAAIANLRRASQKVIVVIVSGRPLDIANELPRWDAAVAAWLPGSEGAGVADALFGATPFTGTLPLPWPRAIGTGDNDALFPRGFGLRTTDDADGTSPAP